MRLAARIGLGLVAVLTAIAQVHAATAERASAGAAGDGAPIEAITLTARSGVSARIHSFAATDGAAPIAASPTLQAASGAPVASEFDWRQTGPQTSDGITTDPCEF
jgi:hypothetical protein